MNVHGRLARLEWHQGPPAPAQPRAEDEPRHRLDPAAFAMLFGDLRKAGRPLPRPLRPASGPTTGRRRNLRNLGEC